MSGTGRMIQNAFSAGELSPALGARADLAKYHLGAALLRNFFVNYAGGASTRPGSEIVGRCRMLPSAGTGKPRNIDFIYNQLQAYVLEFSHLKMRVIMDGGYVLEPAKTLVGVTQANPAVFNIVSHGFSVGDQLFIAGALGMTAINSTAGFQCLVATAPDANHVTLTNLDGAPINTAALPAYTASSGTIARVFTLATPWAGVDLPLLKYVQNADTLTLTHPLYQSRNITRTQHWVWQITAITFTAAVQPPTSGAATPANSTGTSLTDYYYVLTSLTDNPSEESVACAAFGCTNSPLNQNTATANTVSWGGPSSGPAPNRYNVYRAQGVPTGSAPPTIFGYIGQSTNGAFIDSNFAPDFTQAPPTHADPTAGATYPGCATYYQGRKIYAGANATPDTLNMSKSGNVNNMDTRTPAQSDDAITITLSSRQVNAVKHLLAINALIALTSSGAWMISPGATASVLTPTAVVATPQAYNGCSDVPPLPINYDILYVQARGAKVRDLAFNFYVNVYTGNDISVLASHLFFGYQILEWTYAEEPFYLIYAIRNDGVMLVFTYLKEQEVYAWTHYDTPGNSGADTYISVASIPEDQENAVYTVVERTIPGVNGGQPVYYQERLASRNFYNNGVADVRFAWCVDSGVSYANLTTTIATLSGLDHLNGCTVKVLGDGSVQNDKVVVNGSIALDEPCNVVIAGLGYVCQLRTLRIETPAQTVQGKRKKVTELSMIVQDSRGLKAAPMKELANGSLTIGPLIEIKERSNQNYGAAVPLRTGIESLTLSPQWQVEGSVFIQQDYPLPSTILALVPRLSVGDDEG